MYLWHLCVHFHEVLNVVGRSNEALSFDLIYIYNVKGDVNIDFKQFYSSALTELWLGLGTKKPNGSGKIVVVVKTHTFVRSSTSVVIGRTFGLLGPAIVMRTLCTQRILQTWRRQEFSSNSQQES